MLGGGGHRLVHGVRIRPFHEVRRPAVTAEQVLQLLVADARQQRGVVDLVAVEMKDGQHRAVASGIEKLVDVPGSRQRAGFRFAIAHHRGDDQLGIVERRAAGVRQHVAQFAAFVDGARRLRRAMAADPSRKGELLEEFVHAFLVLALLRINLRVRAFQVDGPQYAGRAVSRTGQEDHVQIVFLDQPVQVNIDERQARARSPVAEQAVLDVFRPERLLQQRVLLQVDHPQGEVIAGPPVGIRLAQIVRAERSSFIVDRAFPYALRERVSGAVTAAAVVICTPYDCERV